MIHDEVSTVLRGIKCKNITVQMSGPIIPIVESYIQDSSIHKHKSVTNTEEDIYIDHTH